MLIWKAYKLEGSGGRKKVGGRAHMERWLEGRKAERSRAGAQIYGGRTDLWRVRSFNSNLGFWPNFGHENETRLKQGQNYKVMDRIRFSKFLTNYGDKFSSSSESYIKITTKIGPTLDLPHKKRRTIHTQLWCS